MESDVDVLLWIATFVFFAGAYLYFAGKRALGILTILFKGPGSLRRKPGQKGRYEIRNF